MSEATQYLTLGVGREVFGIPVEHVREILDMREISRLPQAPTYLLGLIDVRGCSVPVIDLRAKLGLASAAATSTTRIVVLEIAIEERPTVLGLVADRVYEVTALSGELEPPPQIGSRWRSDYITGIGRRGDSFVVVFDLGRLFGADEVVLSGLDLGEAA
jgi:purine-binding chemotaxis protein CheW